MSAGARLLGRAAHLSVRRHWSRSCPCCTAAGGGGGRYQYELENRLAFGALLPRTKRKRRMANSAAPATDSVTVISEVGFPDIRLGAQAVDRVGNSERNESAQPTAVDGTSFQAGGGEESPKHAKSNQAISGDIAEAKSDSTKQIRDSAVGAPSASGTSPRPTRRSSIALISATFRDVPLSGDQAHMFDPPGFTYSTDTAPPDPTEGGATSLPSVTRILEATMSEESRAVLQKWEEKMILKHGPDGFRRIKRAMFGTGRQLHQAIHYYLVGGPEPELSPHVEPFWRSVRPTLSHVDTCRVAATEKPVRHEMLGYAGIIDCVAQFRCTSMVIEWKTARRPKPRLADLYDNPIQAAAYIGAYNYTHRNKQVSHAAVVVAYDTGRPATVHVLSPATVERYWRLWLHRLARYKQMAAA